MSQPTMREFALLQTAVLLRRLAFEVNRAAKNGDHAAVHDLRVAIRRFSRSLRVFAQFYPAGSWKRIRRRLRDLMEAAGSVRDRDIALELLAAARIPRSAPVVTRLQSERRRAALDLVLEIRRWKSRNFSQKWRSLLEL